MLHAHLQPCGAVLVAASLALAGCQQLPLTPEDLQARKFESLPEKAVIYVVRDSPDFSDREATIWLGAAASVKTYPGTYYRWEVPPGMQRVSGYGSDTGAIALLAEAGRIYFVMLQSTPFMQWQNSHFYLVPEPQGRSAVLRSVLLMPRGQR